MRVLYAQLPHLESLWRKVGDVVSIKVEEHQLFSPSKGLGMDGLDGISLQVDAFNLWDCS